MEYKNENLVKFWAQIAVHQVAPKHTTRILWGQSHLQKLQETVSGGAKHRIRISRHLKPYFTPSQMFSQERFEASFEITHQKLWNVYKKAYVLEFPLNKIARLQSTAYYRTRNFTADYFSWSAQKPLQNCPFFSNITNLQTRIPDLNKNVDSTKIISSECSLK